MGRHHVEKFFRPPTLKKSVVPQSWRHRHKKSSKNRANLYFQWVSMGFFVKQKFLKKYSMLRSMGMRGSLGLILYQVVVLNSTSYPENMSPQLFFNFKIRTIWIFGGKVHQTQAIPLVFPIGFT